MDNGFTVQWEADPLREEGDSGMNDFLNYNDEIEISKAVGATQPIYKLATVSALFSNGVPKLLMDGETIASEKKYAYLSSYTPAVNDRVLLIRIGSTMIILGKVIYRPTLGG
jgi:hypothetical protein